MLHVDFGEVPSPLLSLATLFDGTDPYGDAIDWQGVDARIANGVRLVINLRKRVKVECDEKIDVLLLLDCLLIQIGGVTFGTTYNKIVSVGDAAALFRYLVQWYRKVFPTLIAQ